MNTHVPLLLRARTSFFIIALCLSHSSDSQLIFKASNDTICDRNYLKDVSSGTFDHRSKAMIHENVSYSTDKYFIQNDSTIVGCVCDVQICVPKCCGPNQIDKCDPGFSPEVNLDLYSDNLTTPLDTNVQHQSVPWTRCQHFETNKDELDYYLKPDGQLYIPGLETHADLHQYCVLYNETAKSITVKICTDVAAEEKLNEVNKYGMLISIPFLFLTLLVYVILPEKKIQTKCLMAYVTCLMFAYFFLIYLQLASLEDPECTIFASCGIYFFMATFCWMNVTCVDMFWTFSGRRPFQQGNSSKWKRFGMYCLFANGAPFILLGVIFGLNSLEEFKGHPGFADGQCWLEQGLPQLLYFYGPMAVLLTINTILFIITAITIRSTIVDNQRMLRGSDSHRHNDDNKQDYRLYIKLFIAMGINWIMEFISWIVDWNLGSNKIPWLWYPTDFCNAIYGVFIFMIFVCKKTVWIKLRQRYYILMGKPNMARALSTRTSGYQMSQTERTNMDESTVYK